MRHLSSSVRALLGDVWARPGTVPLHVFNSLLATLAATVTHSYLCLHLFRRRLLPHRRPDAFTLSSLATSLPSHPLAAAALHSLSFRLGLLLSDPVLANSLFLLYLRSGLPSHAHNLFDQMPTRTPSSWNTLISHSASQDNVWDLLTRMLADRHAPDGFTVSAVLPACSFLRRGKEIHGFAVKNGLCHAPDFHVGSGLVSMYCRVGRPELAWRVFDGMERRNVVSWTAMIGGCAENGMFEDALMAFRAIWVRGGVAPNRITLISVLSAVGALGGLAEGKQVHSFVVRMGLREEVSLNNSLIDMYSKCGSLGYARRIFDDGFWCKDVISWSSMILGYGIHGMGEEAVALFKEMCSYGIRPDGILGLVVLSACCRAGLVAKGLEIYNSLVKDHGVCPTVEICACMVDLLGRAGHIDCALDFIKSMSIAPSPSVWGALLDASMIHNNEKIQDLACRSLLELEEGNPSNLVSVSNLHASSGRWNIVEQVRIRMKETALKKMRGCSWVNANVMEQSS